MFMFVYIEHSCVLRANHEWTQSSLHTGFLYLMACSPLLPPEIRVVGRYKVRVWTVLDVHKTDSMQESCRVIP